MNRPMFPGLLRLSSRVEPPWAFVELDEALLPGSSARATLLEPYGVGWQRTGPSSVYTVHAPPWIAYGSIAAWTRIDIELNQKEQKWYPRQVGETGASGFLYRPNYWATYGGHVVPFETGSGQNMGWAHGADAHLEVLVAGTYLLWGYVSMTQLTTPGGMDPLTPVNFHIGISGLYAFGHTHAGGDGSLEVIEMHSLQAGFKIQLRIYAPGSPLGTLEFREAVLAALKLP